MLVVTMLVTSLITFFMKIPCLAEAPSAGVQGIQPSSPLGVMWETLMVRFASPSSPLGDDVIR